MIKKKTKGNQRNNNPYENIMQTGGPVMHEVRKAHIKTSIKNQHKKHKP
jgi:hypothetical protein